MASEDLPLQLIPDELAEVATVAGHLWDRGWAERNAGNISLDVTERLASHRPDPSAVAPLPSPAAYPELAGRAFLVTGAGTRMREVAREPARHCCLVWMADDARRYQLWRAADREDLRPTSELSSHLAVHALLRRANRAERCFLHTHPNELVALTHLAPYQSEQSLNGLLWAMHPEVKMVLPEGVGYAPYRPPGSQALAEVTLAALATHRAAVWEKHGCVAVGRDPAEAFDLIDTVNKAASLFLLCRAAGLQPEGLSPGDLQALEHLAGQGGGP